MKRKVKKFVNGGLATQGLTFGPGMPGTGSGGLSGIGRNIQDISLGASTVEQGLNRIRSGDNQNPFGGGSSTPLGGTATSIGASQTFSDKISSILSGPQMRKGGRVNAAKTSKKSTAKTSKKSTTKRRGDGCIIKGKTKGRMV